MGVHPPGAAGHCTKGTLFARGLLYFKSTFFFSKMRKKKKKKKKKNNDVRHFHVTSSSRFCGILEDGDFFFFLKNINWGNGDSSPNHREYSKKGEAGLILLVPS